MFLIKLLKLYAQKIAVSESLYLISFQRVSEDTGESTPILRAEGREYQYATSHSCLLWCKRP